MASIYEQEKSSIYGDGSEDQPVGLPENVARPKAAYTVLASGTNSPDTLERIDRTERELSVNTSTADEDTVNRRAEEEHNNAKQELILDIAKTDAPVDERTSAAESVAQADYEPDLVTEAVVNQASQFDPVDEDEREVHRNRVSEQLLEGTARIMLDNREFQSAIQELQEEVSLALSGGGTAETSAEFGELLAPFTVGEVYSDIAKDLFPEEANRVVDFTLAGETQVFLREKFQNMSPEEREVMLPQLKQSIIDNAGIVTDNGMLAQMLVGEVFSEELGIRQEGDFDWDRLFNNVTGVLDTTVILGSAVRLGGKLLKAPAMGKVLGAVDRGNPEVARDIRAALVSGEDTSTLEKASGVTSQEAMIDLYPTFRGAFNSVTPSHVVDQVANTASELRKVQEDIAFGINYTQDEIMQMQERVLDAYKKRDGSYNQSFSELDIIEDEGKGFTVRAAIGPNDNTGFGSYQDALAHFNDNFPEGTNVDFMVRDGDLVREAKQDELWGLQDNEVWYRVEEKYDYNVSMLDENTLLFGGPTIEKGFAAKRLFRDPASLFSRFVNKAGTHAHDFGLGVSGRMFNAFQRGVLSQSRNSQLKIFDAIDEGSRLEKNFTYEELIGRGLSDSEAIGYFTARGVMDLEWALNNTRIFNTLKRDGFESVVNYNNGFETFGRRMDVDSIPLSNGKVKVFDPDSNTITTLNRTDLDNLYENGGQVLKSKTVIKAGGDEGVTHVAAGLGSGTSVRPLTLNPLQYRPGYVTRFYDENYFVKMRKTEVIDGTKTERFITVAAAPTKTDANRLAEKLKEQNPKADFDVALDQKLDQSQVFEDEFEYLHRTGGIITGRRGERLKGINDAAASVIDPVQSMMDSITYTSKRISHDDTIASLERRWVNAYGRKFGLNSIPDNLNDIRGGTATEAGVSEAKAHAGYIQGLKGIQGADAQWWRSAMLQAAEAVEGLFGGGRAAQRTGDFVRGFNPMKTLRGLTFNMLLATNPTRQLLLQANQITFLTGIAPVYIAGGGLARDAMAFFGAAATRNRPMWGTYKKRAAKLMKMSEDDFQTMYDGFVRSGLPFSIDSHSFARDGLQGLSKRISGNLAQRGLRTSVNGVKAPMLAMKRVGFDAGEYSNLSMTWLVAFRDWQKKNPGRNWRTKAAMDDISTEARDLSLNMTKTGELPYQRGVLSLATQFLSYQHKALLAIAQQNKAFNSLTMKQRIGIGVAQFLLYGADGLGMGAMVDKIRDQEGYDIPDEVMPILDGLGYEYALNGMINSLTQDGTDINFSASLAPGSGVLSSFGDLIHSMKTMDAPTLMLGATTSSLGRVNDAVRMINTINEIPDLSTSERLDATLTQAGQVLGGYSNYVKGQAMKNIGYAVSSNGSPMYKTTYSEGLFQQLFGIGPEAQDDYFRIIQEMNGAFVGDSVIDQLGGPSEGDIDAIAETYYDRVTTIFREMSYDDMNGRDDLWWNQLRSKVALENTVMAVLPNDVAYAVRKRINDRIDRNINTTGVDDMIQYMARAVVGGTEPLDTRRYYTRLIKNADFRLTPQQEQDVESLIDFLTTTEGME